MAAKDQASGGSTDSRKQGDYRRISRRGFVGTAAGAAAAAGLGSLAGADAAAEDNPITTITIREAEKLHALQYTEAERRQLLQTIPGQVAAVVGLRQIPRPRELAPAIVFDPRLPGVEYPPQENRVRLAAGDPGPLPSDDADIAFAPVTSLARWIRTGDLTSARLTEIYLDRIRRIAPELYCYITVTGDLASAQARAMDAELAAGRYRGPLHGIPYGIKDVFDTAGIATTWGAAPFKDRVPTGDARIVEMLRDAGAVLLGKQATGAIANGYEWFGGKCRNPWNTDEPSGGSSAGPGSATAAGLCAFAIGTDSLGSILNPADRCGIVGLRATFGRVPTRGAMPLTPSLDRIGPLCRTVEDAALVIAAINGPDPTSPTSVDVGFSYDGELDVAKLRVGYSPGWFERIGFGPGASVPVARAHLNALEALNRLGVELVEVELEPLPYGFLINNLNVEAAALYEDMTLAGSDEQLEIQESYAWPNSWRQARLLSAVDYLQLERFRRQVMEQMHRIFSEVDAVFGPTYGSFDLLLVTNYTGHPGISLRAGLGSSPTRSIMFTPVDPKGPERTITHNVAFHGRLYQEGTILALAGALEAELGVWRHRPPVG